MPISAMDCRPLRRGWIAASAALLGLVGVAAAPVRAQGDFTWIESDQVTASNLKGVADAKFEASGWGRTEFLSEGKLLQVSIDADKVDKALPAGGGLISYDFTAKKAGKHAIWNRIGFEFVRSPFEWRVDGGEWATVKPTDLTTDLMELALWNEIAWIKMGERDLSAGPHKIEIRLPKTEQTEGNNKGKTAKVLYASDVLFITPNPFYPNGKYKPGENYRDTRDEEATANVFRLPEPATPGARSFVDLKGLWEVARYEEALPTVVGEPIKDFPTQPHWKAIPIPSDKNKSRPDLIFAHRLWYRTRIDVPASQAGRSFYVEFPYNNLNTTVYVNGVYCGFHRQPFSRVRIDVTKGIKPGQVNELWVGIKDAWYGFTANPDDPTKLRSRFNYPLEWANKGFMDLDYPVWNAFQSGIIHTPTFVAGGATYASDVFVKPQVTPSKALNAEVTLTNTTGADARGEVRWEAVDVKTGKVEKTFAAQPFTVGAGKDQTVNLSAPWETPTLWWPNEAHLYDLRTTVVVDGRPIDVADTRFGFREWKNVGKKFTLNGIVWHIWADLVGGGTKEQWLENYRRTNQRMQRFSDAGQADNDALWHGLESREALRFFDENGVVVRRNGPMDGEVIGYQFSEGDPVIKAKQGGSSVKKELMRNFLEQMVAQVKGERNHPSVHAWTIENEFAYINLINLLGNSPTMDEYEAEIQKVSDAVMAVDPTRTVMIDGGGALKNNTLPVHGDHYVYSGADDPGAYPDLAYQPNTKAGGRGRWEWDQQRPRYLGEDYFATGINPFDYSPFGGEAAFQGKAAARPSVGLVYQMLQQGYRWGGHYAAWHFWVGEDTGSNMHGSNPWLAAFTREWDNTFAAGQSVKRTFGIFNDTRHPEPVTFTWTFMVNGKRVAGETSQHNVAPGTNKQFPVTIAMPKVGVRTEGQLVLTLTQRGQEQFRDVKQISVLPTPSISMVSAAGKPTAASTQTVANRGAAVLKASDLLVYDPAGTVAAYLRGRGYAFTPIQSLAGLPAAGRVLIVGKNALTVAESTSSQLAAWASAGRRVIVLEQENPLKYQAIPAEMESTAEDGQTAFGEDMTHPVMKGLAQKDFFTWGPGVPVYVNAYLKPARGAKSLVQVDKRLQSTALVEVPINNGLMLLSQLTVGANAGRNVVAQQLLANLIDYAAAYKQEFRPVALVAGDNAQLVKAMDSIGVRYTPAADPVAAMSASGVKLVVVDASPANLKALAENAAKVKSFNAAGGYIVLNNLTPQGIDDYNRLVGFDHMIRKMRRERVTFPATRNPLTSGLSTGDIVMLSGERIFGWTSDEFVADDVFSYVVDFDEVAPFGTFKNDFYYNMVNGMVSSDAWKYIVNVSKDENKYELTLPKPQEITEFTWVGNTFYNPTTRVELIFDGNEQTKTSFKTEPNNDPQTFDVTPPRAGKVITVHNAEWITLPDKKEVIGVDNIYLKAKRPADFYKNVRPMLNIGGMMEYPRGSGGLVLVNLLFKDAEANPINASKKRTILSTVLRNLDAPFAGGKAVIAGANLNYAPVDISKQATQYRTERGWFGDAKFTFAALPSGKQNFAGVTYDIYDFPTSPVPTAVMLGGRGVPNNVPQEVKGIPVGRKADALFFLHTARMDNRRNERDLRENKKYEMLRYVVHYADGKEEIVPIYAEIDIDDYRQQAPKAIPGAQIAWTRPYEGTEFTAVAYSKQWNNPRPDVEIASVDMVYGPDKRGVPVLLALTAATAPK